MEENMTDIRRESVAPVEEKEQMIKKLSFIIIKKKNQPSQQNRDTVGTHTGNSRLSQSRPKEFDSQK